MDYFLVALAGLFSGMLVNYLADVLPVHRRLAAPNCGICGTKYPLGDYLLWPRRCKACGDGKRPFRTWVVEFLFIGGALWLWSSPPDRLGFIGGLALLVYLGLIAVIDIEHRLILNITSLLGAVLGVIVGTLLHGLRDTILGGLAGFGAMFALYGLGAALMGWLAKKRGQKLDEEALGFGDVNLAGILGFILGWPGILLGLLLTILLGGIASLVYLLISILARRYRFDMAIPYGPFLISSAIALIFFRDLVLNYLGW